MKQAIAKKLLELRGNKGREEIAKALRIGVSTLQMYENAQRVPRDDIKVRIARYYGVSVESIFFEEEAHESCPVLLRHP